MTDDKARKRDARARSARTGEPYTRARRAVTRQPARAADVPGADGVPQPAAVMLARHIRAASFHLGSWRTLAEGSRALPRDSGPSWDEPAGPTAPVVRADRTACSALLDLELWSERTAMASGAITALPDFSGPHTPEGSAAARALYPQPDGDSGRWCATAGGHLPQPGEEHAGTDAAAARGVRHCLPGPVPAWHLSLHAEGINVRKAQDVVPGTPAAPIWDAAGTLNGYACGWMDRHGDSPGDLAAALEGLAELADQLASVTSQVLGEVTRRAEEGTLDGTAAEQVAAARDRALGVLADQDNDTGGGNHLRAAFWAARAALTGGHAQLPPAGERISLSAARQMAGKTTAQIRAELGNEMFYQRQRSKTRPTDYARAASIERILTWMHCSGAASYDPAAHAGDDPAAAL